MNRLCSILCISLILALTTFAQNTTGKYIGSVSDSNGATIAGAKVKIESESLGILRIAYTDKNGEYFISNLPIGTYELSFESKGFKRRVVKNKPLGLDQVIRVNALLVIGDIKETLIIDADESRFNIDVNTDTAELNETIQNKRIVDMPLNGRLFLQLAQLTPGVAENARGSLGQQLTAISGPRISVMGARESDNFFTIDGITATNRFFNTLSVPVSVDAVQEFKVQSKLYSTESGTLGGAQINIAIKSGTNDLHGSVYSFLRNDRLNARNFFDSTTKSKFQQGQFGGTIGGAIIEKKLFYFGNYEGLRSAKTQTRLFTVPTSDQRNGIFTSPIKDPFKSGKCNSLDTTACFEKNIIPDSRINPAVKELLNFLPTPNMPGSINNFSVSPKERNDSDQFTVKTNYRKGNNDEFAVRYTFYNLDAFQPYGNVIFSSSNLPLPFGQFLLQRSQNISVTQTHIFTPTVIGEIRAGFNRTAGGQTQQNNNLNFASKGLIAGMSVNPGDLGLPRVIAGSTTFGDVATPLSRRDNDTQVGYNLSLFKSKHSLYLGGMYRRLQFNPQISAFPRGQLSFTGDFSGNAFADLLLGFPRFALGGNGSSAVYLRGNEYALFLQDNFKVSKRLTFNFGVRYEYFSPFSEKYNRWSTLDIENRRVIVASEDGIAYPRDRWVPGIESALSPLPIVTSEEAGLDRSLVKKDLNNLAPRFGFALDIFGNQKTVLRGGYGIFYNASSLNSISLQSFAPPFFNVFTAFALFPSSEQSISNILSNPLSSLSFSPFDVNYRTPYYQQWTLGFQQLVKKDFLIEGQYVGSKGTKLYTSILYNLPDPSPVPPFVQSPALRRLIPNLGSTEGLQTGAASSNYHGAILRVEKRLSNGLMFMGSYTFSKSIDNDSLANSVVTSALDQSNNKSLERALSSFNIQHRLTVSFTYDLPYKSGHKLLNGFLSNWQIGGIVTEQSGQPFSVNMTGDRANTGNLNQRPNVVGNPDLPSNQRTPERWFNTDAFVIQPFGALGNAGRNILECPGTNLVDLSLIKNIPFSDSKRIQFRTEIFNLFNHTNFEVPNRICAGTQTGAPCILPGFGRLTAARDPRIIQLGLKYLF